MRLIINGEPKEIKMSSEHAALDIVIDQLDYHPQSIVVEFNGLIINREKWAMQKVKDGDNIEIVTIVGGGS